MADNLPYNDDYMEYDLVRQQYVLTPDGAYNLLDATTRNLVSEITEDDCMQVSDSVYEYISDYSLYYTYKYKKWLIAKDENLREPFKRLLIKQLRYFIRSGAGVLGDMHGVHIEKSRALGLDNLRGDVTVSRSVESDLKQLGLLYAGHMYYTAFTEDGTW